MSIDKPSVQHELDALAAAEADKARTSLYHAAIYAGASLHPEAARAADLAREQVLLLQRIVRAGLVPFPEASTECRDWLDSRIERLREADPLLARYYDLHEERHRFLPPAN
jgi:hypothetical protein